MAILKKKELKALSTPELEDKASELKTELRLEMGANASGVAPKNPGGIKEIKKTIARINTIINQRSKEV